MKIKSGIYRIVCLIDGKCYVGQSVNVSARLSTHFTSLRKNIHCNRHLQAAFNLYGYANFKREVIERCLPELLNEREIFWINQFDTYNFLSGGLAGFTHAPETKHLISESKEGKKPIFAFTSNGKFVRKWASTKEAARDLQVNPCDIRRTAFHEQHSCKGLLLQYLEEFVPRTSFEEKVQSRKRDGSGKFKERSYC